MQIDYNYLCSGLGHLTGLETRVYKDGLCIEHYTNYAFSPDIAMLIRQEIDDTNDNAFYVETDDLLLFGVIKSKKDAITLIIGPTSQITLGKQETNAILYRLNQSGERLSDLQIYFSNIVPYPFENFLEILCFVNYAINDERLAVADLIKKDGYECNISSDKLVYDQEDQQIEPHNTYEAEKTMLSYVTAGNVEAVEAFLLTPPTGRVGTLAHNELRQRKNAFICAATLISRAAIAGGIDAEAAFALSDRYIQKAELLNSSGDIASLNMQMLMDYTKRVEGRKCGSESSKLVKSVMRYILKHISEKILVDHLAMALRMNRSHLCEKFKQDSGTTISDFISTLKMDEAKRLLSFTELSTSQISEYLAFSSQSYFQTIFKKYVGCTPKEFRFYVETLPRK